MNREDLPKRSSSRSPRLWITQRGLRRLNAAHRLPAVKRICGPDLLHSFIRSLLMLSASPLSRPVSMVRTWEQPGRDAEMGTRYFSTPLLRASLSSNI
jgi:hypothetical protein